MKPLSRRSITTGLAAAVTAIPGLGLCKSVEAGDLREIVYDFARQLLNDKRGLTFGESSERLVGAALVEKGPSAVARGANRRSTKKEAGAGLAPA